MPYEFTILYHLLIGISGCPRFLFAAEDVPKSCQLTSYTSVILIDIFYHFPAKWIGRFLIAFFPNHPCISALLLYHLRKNGAELAAFVAGLSADELDRKGSMPAFGGEASVNQVIEFVIFQSAREHLDSMKSAAGS